MPPHDLSFRPEDLIPNVVFRPNGILDPLSAEDKEKLGDVGSVSTPVEPYVLCRSCDWNTEHEKRSSYLSRLRIVHTRANAGLWTMGNDWAIWDRTEAESGTDFITHQFLKKQNTRHIPLLKEMVELQDEDGRYNFVVMSRAKAVPLEGIWRGLTRKERRSYAEQMVVALRELRQFTADFPQRVDGSPVWDNAIGNCNSRKECIKVGKTADEWLNSMDEELREGLSWILKTKDVSVIDARLQELKKNFPDGAPYVLTHGDLNLGNILVHDGKIEAIIDWELAGYQPWWVEIFTSYNRSLSHAGKELFDFVWKKLDLSMKDAMKDIAPVMQAYERCPVGHTGRGSEWQRPVFCKCQPFGGVIRSWDIDSEDKHFVDYTPHPLDNRKN